MPIFRITGDDRYLNVPREVFVEAASAEQAGLFAHRRGIVNAQISEIARTEVPPEAKVLTFTHRERRAPQDSPLLNRPILSIALGVMFGLLGFVVVMFLLRLFFGVTLFVIDRALIADA